ncbi:MAG: hypothetical protein QHC79_25785 [Pseudosphingobacterium sp.]|nr:hypothetical protein [Pseudosphingobacterium sp.]
MDKESDPATISGIDDGVHFKRISIVDEKRRFFFQFQGGYAPGPDPFDFSKDCFHIMIINRKE